MKLNFKFIKISLLSLLALQIIGLGLLFSAPKIASADKESLNFSPNVSIPNLVDKGKTIPVGQESNGQMKSDLLAKYIKGLYDYGMAAAGILGAIVLMAGGVIWLTSGGDSGKVGQAKELIIGSVSGLVILLSSWIILNTINPDLLALRPISTTYINKIVYICCEENGVAYMKTQDKCTGTKFEEGYYADPTTNKCEQTGCRFQNSGTYISSPTVLNGYCIDSIRSRCSNKNTSIKDSVLQFRVGTKCSSLTECKDDLINKIDCSGKGNGQDCNNTGDFIAHCYNQMCYIEPSNKNEPCGNNGGTCVERKDCQGEYDRREDTFWGGNKCNDGLACCISSSF